MGRNSGITKERTAERRILDPRRVVCDSAKNTVAETVSCIDNAAVPVQRIIVCIDEMQSLGPSPSIVVLDLIYKVIRDR